MKKTVFTLFFLAMTALFIPCCVSCSKNDDKQEEEQNGNKKEKITLEKGTYTFTVSPLKGKWEVGDKIYVHGTYRPAAQMITLAAGDISSDGKTASAYLDKVTEYPIAPDGLYAAWPGDAVESDGDFLDKKNYFPKSDQLLSVAYLSGKDFEFKDAVCGLKFKVSGYSDFVFAANNRNGVGFTSFDVEYTSVYSAFFNYGNNGDPFLKGKLTDGSAILWFPGNQSFAEGFTIYFGDGEKWPLAYNVNSKSLQIGTLSDLGDITAELKTYVGPGPKMPVMGTKTKYDVKFNELSGLCLSSDGDFLWAVDDNGKIGKLSFTGEVLWSKSFSFDPEAITLEPKTGDLLVGNEEPCAVYRIPSPDFNKASHLFTIPGTSSFGNAGIEGLTYYKDGMVYAGTQTGSYLFCLDLSTGQLVGERIGLRARFPSITEIADLCYDPLTDWLWVIDSEARKIFVLTGDAGNMLGAYSVKGISNPESVCVDHVHSCVWVGDDYGSTSYLYKYEFTGLDDDIIEKN